MNRLLYRVVFNKARGMLMAVAEIARTCSGHSPSSGIGHTHARRVAKISAAGLGLYLALGVVQIVQAAIIADRAAPGAQQPTIIGTANGTPQVNIQTPSAGGVSRNSYSQFDVDRQGVILNNSRKNSQSELAGLVTGNPWLAKGEARVILNEVNSRDPSLLHGYIEVAGKKAQVVIANPSGITCDGCGFINAGRTTLTTGSVQLQNGEIAGYRVDRGEVIISGGGLDGTRQDHTDIIARAVKVNAALHAGDLSITTGRNHVDADNQQVTAAAGYDADKPQFALDVAQVGGMYAGKIRLRGTEQGVGVRNAGKIGASAGEVSLSADGIIENSGAVSAQGNLMLAGSGDVTNRGSLWSAASADVTAGAHLYNSGSVSAAGNVTAGASHINNAAGGIVAAGVSPDGRPGGSGSLTLSASGGVEQQGLAAAGGEISIIGQGIDASGGRMQAGNITLDAGQRDLSTARAQVIAQGRLTAAAAGTHDNRGGLLAGDELDLSGRRLLNNGGEIVHSGSRDLNLHYRDAIDNRGGSIAANASNMALDTATLDNREGRIVHGGGGDLLLSADDLAGNKGSLSSSGTLVLNGRDLDLTGSITTANGIRISADNLLNREGQLVQSGQGEMALDIRQHIDNREGIIGANGGVLINAKTLDNRQGQIAAADGGSLTLNASGLADNRQGLLVAADDIALVTGGLTNEGGQIAAEKGWLSIDSVAQVCNRGGQMLASADLILSASGLNNDGGLIQSGEAMQIDTRGHGLSNGNTKAAGGIVSFGTLAVASGAIDNRSGMLAGAGSTALQAVDIDNRGGILASEKTFSAVAEAIDNRSGSISAGLNLAIELSRWLNNAEGAVSAGERMAIVAAGLNNARGAVIAGGAGAFSVMQIDNRRGTIAAGGEAALSGLLLDNDSGGLVQSGGGLRLAVEQIRNRDSGEKGGIISRGEMTVITQALHNDAGLLLAGGHAELSAGQLSNIGGTLVALDALRIATRSDTDNRDGLIQGRGMLIDTGGALLDNRGGTLYSLGGMTLDAGGLNNQRGTLGAKGDAALTLDWLNNSLGGRIVGEGSTAIVAASIDNRSGQIQSVGALSAGATGTLDNRSGLIRSGDAVDLSADALINSDTLDADRGIEGRSIATRARTLDNGGGSVLAAENLDLNITEAVNNARGALAAGGALSLGGTSLELVNTAGVIKAGRKVTIDADRLGGDGQLLSLGEMALSSRRDVVNSGEMIANGTLTLATPGRVTNAGKLLSGATLDLTSGSLLNTASGEIAGRYTWLTVAGVLTNSGLIDGGWTLLKSGTLINTGSGRIYGDYVGIQATTLNNLASGGKAAVIAGRERVDLGVGTLNNREHGLIFSAGDMAIGGALNESGTATGQAVMINNRSATVEALGNMSLAARQLNNINDHFSTEVVQVSSDAHREYQHGGDDVRWDAATEGVFVDNNSSDGLLNLNTPGRTGHNNDDFYQYDYTRTIREEVIKESDPGKILAGGYLAINAGQVLNDKSQIVAGGTLGIAAGSVDNLMPEGSRWVVDEGTLTHYYRKHKKGGDKQKEVSSLYQPPEVIQSITLRPGSLSGNATVDGSGLHLDAAHQQGTDIAIDSTGSVSANLDGSKAAPGWQDVGGAELPPLNLRDFPPQQPVVLLPGQQLEVPAGGDDSAVVRITGPDTRLPDNSLFITRPAPDAKFLVETDPRFTNNRQWLGSDYMQDAFARDRDNLHKRLGDGFYEQRLVREQVIAITGGRYLSGYRSDEEQFKALMDAGIAFGKKYNIAPGAALSAEQMRLLTEDMIWLVSTRVQLPDGSWQTVLVPQVYAHVTQGDLDGSGALLGGENIVLNLSGDLLNTGSIGAREVVQLSADNITNRAGAIQGADVNLQARTDINNIAGIISGNNAVLASAGRDINVVTTTRSAQNGVEGNSFTRTTIDRTGGIYVQGEDGRLSLAAGRDVNLAGAQVVNGGEGGVTVIGAGRDVNMTSVVTSASDSISWDSSNWLTQSETRHVGTEVVGAGAVTIIAVQDVNASGAAVTAEGRLGVGAGRDINIDAAADSSAFESHHKSSGSSGAFSKTTTTAHDKISHETAQGSVFSGDSVVMQADNNLRIRASDIVADGNVTLRAGNDLTVTGAEERLSESHLTQEKKNGLSGTGGIGASYGSQSQKVTDTAQSITQRGSTVGSVNGDVTLSAGSGLSIHGSDVVAGNDITLVGKNVSVTAAEEQTRRTHEVEQKSSGLTLGLSGSAGSAASNALQAAKRASGSDDSRLAALQGVQAALGGAQASQAVRMDDAQGNLSSNNNTAGITVSAGSQSSKSIQTVDEMTSKGSSLSAGNNVTVVATGGGHDSRDGDILIQGSQVSGGNDVLLSAERDVNLVSAENTSSLEGKNKSSGGSVGVGVGVGSGGWGINLSASANAGKGKERGSSTTHAETAVEAGNNLSIVSGRDTNLIGAQVKGESVTADIGRDLTIRSEQDSDSYRSRQQNVSGGGSFNIGSMSGSGGISASQDKMSSDYRSVNEQSGIAAGSGGFDIRVGGHTQLDGGIISSAADESKNRLDTGTLGWTDIRNEAEYSTEHAGVSMSTGGSVGGQFMGNLANNVLSGVSGSSSAQGITRSAVEGGTIIVRDPANQQQDVTTLSRDTVNANGRIDAIFDKEKEQRRLDEAQLIAEIGSQVSDIARTEDDIAAAKTASEKRSSANEKERDEAKAAWEKANPGKTASEQDVNDTLYQNAYADAIKEAKHGTGSRTQQAIQAVTAAAQGAAGGNVAAAIAGAAGPYVAEVIGHSGAFGEDEVLKKAAAHAVTSAVLSAVAGKNAAAGAAGALTGELVGALAREVYGKHLSDLTESERQKISALATIAAGIAGGLAGGSAIDAVSGAGAGKGVVENNSLGGWESLPKGMMDYGSAATSLGQFMAENGATPAEISQAQQDLAKGVGTGAPQPATELVKKWVLMMSAAATMGTGTATGAGAAVTGGVIGGAANISTQVTVNGDKPFSYTDALIAIGTGAITQGKGPVLTGGVSVGGAYVGSTIKGEDPTNAMIGAGVGSAAGSGVGKVVTDKLKPVVPGSATDLTGDIFGSGAAELVGSETQNQLDARKEKK